MFPQKPKTKILIIEDSEAFREIYRDVLEHRGYEVYEAVDGEEGIEILSHETPQLIILDLMLPKIDGFEVLKFIRGSSKVKEVPVIILTARGTNNDLQRGLALGATDYIEKGSIPPAEILLRIDSLLVNAS